VSAALLASAVGLAMKAILWKRRAMDDRPLVLTPGFAARLIPLGTGR
jgi:hypothetical protein